MSSLSVYSQYVDLETERGIKLYTVATETFRTELRGTIKLDPSDAKKFVREIETLSDRFSYKYIVQNVPTTRTVTPADPNVANSVETVTLGGPIKILENFCDKNIDFARKYASIVWGNDEWDTTSPMNIRPLRNQSEIVAGNITALGKNLLRDRMHSKFLAIQVLALLDDDAQEALQLDRALFTWTSADGRDTEQCGVTILAIVMSRLKPHYKVDLFAEVEKIKSITLAQFGSNLLEYFDAVKQSKKLIDSKSKRMYSDDMFLQDVFKQLKNAPVDSFVQKYELLEADWLVDKIQLTSANLMRDASSHYRQLDAKKQWKGQLNARAQVVLLTTQVHALSTELAAVKSSGSATPTKPNPTNNNTNQQYPFEPWRLTKIDNGKEHSAIEKNGKTWYFCEDGHKYDEKDCGMYVLHKPGQGHIEWRKRIDDRKAKRREQREKRKGVTANGGDTTAKDDAATATGGSSNKKLSLNTSLQAALTTQCGLSPEEANKLWADVCSESGN